MRKSPTLKSGYLKTNVNIISIFLLVFIFLMLSSFLPVNAAPENHRGFLPISFGDSISLNRLYSRIDIPIKGAITDQITGEPLAGVTVQVKGEKVGTSTDINGNFSLNAPENGILIITSVGYESVEVQINNRNIINVSLIKASGSLDGVVVIGYGTQRKSDLTGSVGTVRETELKQRSSASLNQSLSGKIPGVQVNTNSGRPGGKNNVRIRGFSSINSSNNPLYVVDGVMIPMNDQLLSGASNPSQSIDYINPNDIVSVEVLKDASATAIYGARGANGVILITTKRGRSGESRVTYDGEYSIGVLGPNFPKFLNAKEFLAVEDLAYKNMEKYDPAGWAAGKYAFRDPALARTDSRLFDSNGNPIYETNWIKVCSQHKLSQNQQLGFSGGNGRTTYALSFNYRNDNGLIKTSYLKRYSVRFTVDDQIKKWFKIGATISYLNQEENLVDFDYLPMRTIAEAFPFMPVKYTDGTWADNRDYRNAEGQFNPMHYLYGRKYILNTQNTIGNFYSNLNLAKGLEMRTSFGANILNQGLNAWTSRTLAIAQQGTASTANRRESFWSLENYLTYNKTFAKNHSITGLLGISWQETNTFSLSESSQGFSSDFFEFNNVGAGSTNTGYSSSRSRYAFNSYFGRINYSLKNRYLLTFTGREDGSSKFGENNKYAFFPSAALAWKLSEEDFLKNNTTISNLKLRASFGVTGNSEIAPYSSLSTLSSGYAAIIGDQRVGGTGIARLANPELKWEKTTQKDIGLELGLFKGKVSLEADVYYRKTTDMLLDAPVPTTSGYASITKNIGSMENKGLEVGLNTVNIDKKNFSWKTNFNISMNRNKVLALATPADIYGVGGTYFISPTNVISVGQPVGSFRGLVRLGVWSEAERAEAASFTSYRSGLPILPGDIKYLDVNKDRAITDADRMIIGNGSPKGWGAFTNSFRYKNFDLIVELQYSYGNKVYELSTGSSEDRVALANSYKTVLNAWTPQNQNTVIPELRDTRAGYIINEDTHWLKDGSFLRGRNLLLSYNFPQFKLGTIKLERFRIYGSAQNFFLICDKAVNGDPETVGSTFGTGAFAQGLTYHAYPKSTTFTLGLNVAF